MTNENKRYFTVTGACFGTPEYNKTIFTSASHENAIKACQIANRKRGIGYFQVCAAILIDGKVI